MLSIQKILFCKKTPLIQKSCNFEPFDTNFGLLRREPNCNSLFSNSFVVVNKYPIIYYPETIKGKIDFDAVCSGAILSDYQRVRVENVCSRLGLVSLSYLWRRDQAELFDEMIDAKVEAILIKVATLGLDEKHLGLSLSQDRDHLHKMVRLFKTKQIYSKTASCFVIY